MDSVASIWFWWFFFVFGGFVDVSIADAQVFHSIWCWWWLVNKSKHCKPNRKLIYYIYIYFAICNRFYCAKCKLYTQPANTQNKYAHICIKHRLHGPAFNKRNKKKKKEEEKTVSCLYSHCKREILFVARPWWKRNRKIMSKTMLI